MKITKCLLVASAAALAGSLMHNAPNQKNDLFKASVLDENVQRLMTELKYHQGRTYVDNFANYYFSNLRSNYSLNAHGTCSFVSIGMLLSYYDTYLDDNFIPNAFEQNTFIEPNENGTIIPKDVESPGVVSEDYDLITSMDEVDYEDYVVDNPNASFQNFLMMYACENTDGFTFDSFNHGLGMSIGVQVELLNSYLSDYVGLQNSVFSYTNAGYSQYQLKNLIKQHIDNGEPVIINFRPNIIGDHSAIAYDYDGDDIYVHTGWKDANGDSLTHVKLDDLHSQNVYGGSGELVIKSICGIDTSNYPAANNQNNYITVDENDNVVPANIKTLAIPHDIRLEYDSNTPDILPVLRWNSLYNERWFNNQNITFQVKIRNSVSGNLIRTINVRNETSVVIPEDVFSQVIDEFGLFEFTVEMRTVLPEIVVGNNRVVNQSTIISNKNDYERIQPADYGFPTNYRHYTSNFVDAFTQEDFDFKVRRSNNVIRAGNYIKLDVNYKSSTEAFVEYNFYKPITEIKLSVSEYGDSNGGVATASNYNYAKGALFVQGFRNNTYFPDIADKTQNERHENSLIAGQETEFSRGNAIITYQFSAPVYRVRIHASANEPEEIGLNPIGRIGKIGAVRSFSMYLSDVFVKPAEGDYLAANGYEFHQGSQTNCNFNDYVYALSLDTDVVDSDYEPGYYTSDEYFDYSEDERTTDIDVITALAEADAAPNGLTGSGYIFEEIDKHAIPADGCYKVALAILKQENNPNALDYRFMRQNSDGSWSYVSFDAARIKNTDAYGNVIYDPINLTCREGNAIYRVRSVADLKVFQVSRDKGSLSAEEVEGEYFPMIDANNHNHDFTWDERPYIIQPPFRPIFTGEF